MRTVDHKILARLIINRYMSNISDKFKKTFYIGCVEPDYNLLSFFHGFFKHRNLYGHNFCNVQPFIEKLLKRLIKSKRQKTFFYFHLGLLIHYITDAFTFAHTSSFNGSLREHSEYEENLHQTFLKLIYGNKIKFNGDFLPVSNITELSRIHNMYTKGEFSVYNDIVFIITLTGCIMDNIVFKHKLI